MSPKDCASPYPFVHNAPVDNGGEIAGLDTQTIDAMNADGLERLARYYENTARKLALRAASLRAQEDLETSARANIESALSAAHAVLGLMDQGLSIEQATDQIARSNGVPRPQLEAHLKHALKAQTKKARHYRRAMVAKLAARSWTNGEIATRLGVHRNTVSNDIAALYRKKA